MDQDYEDDFEVENFKASKEKSSKNRQVASMPPKESLSSVKSDPAFKSNLLQRGVSPRSLKKSLNQQIHEEIENSPELSEKKEKKKKFLSEVDMSKVSSQRHSFAPSTMNFPKTGYQTTNYLDQFRSMIHSDSSSKSVKEVDAENNKLRSFLKDLNETLTKHIKNSKPTNPNKVVEFKYKSEEEQLRTINQEVENNKQILELKMMEYKKLKNRMEVVKNPNYIITIEEQIADAKKKAEEIKRGNQKLSVSTIASGKNLNHIENIEGVPLNIKEANEKTKDLSLLRKKLESLRESNQNFNKEKQEKTAKIQELTHEYTKLLSGTGAGTEESVDPKVLEKYNTLEQQCKTLQDNLRHIEKKNEKHIVASMKREQSTVELAIDRDNELIAKLDDMIQKQVVDLKEMIDKEGMRSDKTMQDVLSKMKSSIEVKHPIAIQELNPSKISNSKLPSRSSITKLEKSTDLAPLLSPKEKIRNQNLDPIKKKTEISKTPSQKTGSAGSDKVSIPEKFEEPVKLSPKKLKEDSKKSPVKKEKPQEELFIEDNIKDFEEIDSSKPFQRKPTEPKEKEEIALPQNFKKSKPKKVDPEPEQYQDDLHVPEKEKKINESPEKQRNEVHEDLVLNDEFKPKKKKSPKKIDHDSEYEVILKQKEIVDPFAKFDNVDPLELTKDKNKLPGSEIPTEETFGVVSEKKKKKSTRPRNEGPSEEDGKDKVFDLSPNKVSINPDEAGSSKKTIQSSELGNLREISDSKTKPRVRGQDAAESQKLLAEKAEQGKNDFFEDLDM